jgi:hypothetical protein
MILSDSFEMIRLYQLPVMIEAAGVLLMWIAGD